MCIFACLPLEQLSPFSKPLKWLPLGSQRKPGSLEYLNKQATPLLVQLRKQGKLEKVHTKKNKKHF